MFDVGWSELVVIGVVALIVIGPKELPGVLRMVGQWTTKMRRMASDFQGQFQEAMREAEIAEMHQQFQDTGKQIGDLAARATDPVGTLKSDIESMVGAVGETPAVPATDASAVSPAVPAEAPDAPFVEPPAPEAAAPPAHDSLPVAGERTP